MISLRTKWLCELLGKLPVRYNARPCETSGRWKDEDCVRHGECVRWRSPASKPMSDTVFIMQRARLSCKFSRHFCLAISRVILVGPTLPDTSDLRLPSSLTGDLSHLQPTLIACAEHNRTLNCRSTACRDSRIGNEAPICQTTEIRSPFWPCKCTSHQSVESTKGKATCLRVLKHDSARRGSR